MKRILDRNKVFLIPFTIVWIVLLVVILTYTKADIHLVINKYHCAFSDLFFKYITYLGDGLTPTLIAVVFLIISFRKTIIIGVSAIVAGLFAQVLKRFVFPEFVRPSEFFKGISELYVLPGVELHSFHSFPSGHTTSAFCLAFCLAYFTKNNYLKFLYLSLALLVGYSRMYLSQHFLIDVFFGAILGILVALLSILYFNKILNSNFDNSIRSVLRKKVKTYKNF